MMYGYKKVLLGVVMLFVAGCATSQDRWYNLAAGSNFEKDNYECEVEANQSFQGTDFGSTIERAMLRARCMNIRGWMIAA